LCRPPCSSPTRRPPDDALLCRVQRGGMTNGMTGRPLPPTRLGTPGSSSAGARWNWMLTNLPSPKPTRAPSQWPNGAPTTRGRRPAGRPPALARSRRRGRRPGRRPRRRARRPPRSSSCADAPQPRRPGRHRVPAARHRSGRGTVSATGRGSRPRPAHSPTAAPRCRPRPSPSPALSRWHAAMRWYHRDERSERLANQSSQRNALGRQV
jgi:hypothetical protein